LKGEFIGSKKSSTTCLNLGFSTVPFSGRAVQELDSCRHLSCYFRSLADVLHEEFGDISGAGRRGKAMLRDISTLLLAHSLPAPPHLLPAAPHSQPELAAGREEISDVKIFNVSRLWLKCLYQKNQLADKQHN
jgi:hypothetical protein